MISQHRNDILRYTRLGYKPSQIREKIGNALSRQRIKQIQDELLDSDEPLRNQYEKAVIISYERVKQSYVEKLRILAKQGCTISSAAKQIGKAIVYVKKISKEAGIEFSKSSIPDLYQSGQTVWDWKILGIAHEKETYASGKTAFVKKYSCMCLSCGDICNVLQKNLKSGKSKRCHKCSVTLR